MTPNTVKNPLLYDFVTSMNNARKKVYITNITRFDEVYAILYRLRTSTPIVISFDKELELTPAFKDACERLVNRLNLGKVCKFEF